MDRLPAGLQPLARHLPVRWKRAARQALLSHTFSRAIRQIRRLPAGEPPTRQMLADLRTGWDNQGWDGKLDYLDAIARAAASTSGPILECGSGLSTILMGLLAGARGVPIWSLEHSPEWRARAEGVLQRHQIPGVHLCDAPLRAYDGFSWYTPPLERMPDRFTLVVCDGPPSLVDGGRYGLMPVLGPRLASGAEILFDDAAEEGQPEVLQRWADEAGVRVAVERTPEVVFARVTVP